MPKLPADLPENWTQGQTISPNGTEVGLTEQHGYNYLMKQVNNTQTEVNGINDALPDVAQEATVAEINDKIGTESDADTQPTLFGRLAQLKNVLVEKLAEVLTKVTGVDGKIGTAADGAEQGTLFGKIADAKTELSTVKGSVEQIKNTMPTGIVKSVQRGRASVSGRSGEEIEITPVDANKSIVLVNSGSIVTGDPALGMAAYAYLSDDGRYIFISTGYNTTNQIGIAWQVIEFY